MKPTFPTTSLSWYHWRYRLLRTLGAGGMGVVFEAQDRLGTRVAVKCVKPSFASQEDTGSTPPTPPISQPIEEDTHSVPTHRIDGEDQPYSALTHMLSELEANAPHDDKTRPFAMRPAAFGGTTPSPSREAAHHEKTVARAPSKPTPSTSEHESATRAGPSLPSQTPFVEETRHAPAYTPEDATRASNKAPSDPSPNVLSNERNSSNRSLLYLAREFRLLSSLRHPNIVSVLDYGFDARRDPFFVMELLDNASDLRSICRQADDNRTELAVRLVAQMIKALSYLHRRGILHRDLKPGNVLVQGDNQHVKVLDFGLSILHETIQEESLGVEGTLAYMAPELLKGTPPSFASDLYAVGVILYELLTDKHPFQYNSFGSLLRSVLHNEPDLSLETIPEPLVDILQKLLAKTPEDRYNNAQTLLRDLNQALSLGLPEETHAERESFLQTARFVGRDHELKTLGIMLQRAIAQRGELCFVAGESGVGKSRLLDELRTVALVDGVYVYKGQATRESTEPYSVWRPILRQLALTAQLREEEASLFKLLVPDLPKLLGQPIPDPPTVDIDLNQSRLIRAIGDVLRRQHDPILIILEDLQWASQASLALLSWIHSVLPSLSMLVVATFRNDEAPHLPKLFPNAQTLPLERLTSQHISSLSQSILGEHTDSDTLSAYLERETEGNVFFLVEILRELARSAGSLNRIQSLSSLPERILPGGVQSLLSQRLKRVPNDLQSILHVSAVAGRQLDIHLLHTLYDDALVERFLLYGESTRILDIEDNQWRFSHDKLREAAQNTLSPTQHRSLHTKILHGLETLHADQLSSVVGRLAFHSKHAKDPARELRYMALAGEEYILSGSFKEGIEALDRVLELSHNTSLPEPPDGWMPHRVRWMRQRAEALFGLGSFASATEAITDTFALFDIKTPQTTPDKARALLKQLSKHIVLRNTPRRFLALVKPAALSIEISKLAILQARIGQYQQDGFTLAYNSIVAANSAHRLNHVNVHAQGMLGFLSFAAGFPNLSRSYFERGLTVTAQDPRGATELLLQRAVCHLGQGEFDLGIHTLHKALHTARSIGYQRLCAQNELVLGCCKTHLGLFHDDVKHRTNAVEYYRGSDHNHVWGARVGLALTRIMLAEFTPALDTFNQALNIFNPEDRLQRSFLYGGVATVHARRGDFEYAYEATRVSLQYTRQLRVLPPACHSAVFGPAEAAIFCYAQLRYGHTHASYTQEHCRVLAEGALQRLESFAKRWPLGNPRYLLHAGQLAWLEGREDEAQTLWNESIRAAQALRMPFEHGMASLELGRSYPMHTPLRTHHLEEALQIFERIQVPYHIDLVRAALSQDDSVARPVDVLRNFKERSMSK